MQQYDIVINSYLILFIVLSYSENLIDAYYVFYIRLDFYHNLKKL